MGNKKGSRRNPFELSIYDPEDECYCEWCGEVLKAVNNHDFEENSVLLTRCKAWTKNNQGHNNQRCGAWHEITYYESEDGNGDDEDEDDDEESGEQGVYY